MAQHQPPTSAPSLAEPSSSDGSGPRAPLRRWVPWTSLALVAAGSLAAALASGLQTGAPVATGPSWPGHGRGADRGLAGPAVSSNPETMRMEVALADRTTMTTCPSSTTTSPASTSTTSRPTTTTSTAVTTTSSSRPPTTSTTGPGTTTTQPSPPTTLPPPGKGGPGFVNGRVTAIGDSVMIDVAPALEASIPHIVVDAAVSRQWDQGESEAASLRAAHQLGATVVIDLGTNGPVTAGQFDAMMSVLAGAARVIFVTVHVPTRPWQDEVNATLAAGVARYRNTYLADFNALADQNPQWFYSDGVHMPIGGPGADAFAGLVRKYL